MQSAKAASKVRENIIKLNNKTKSIWHPKLKFANHFNKRYVKDES